MLGALIARNIDPRELWPLLDNNFGAQQQHKHLNCAPQLKIRVRIVADFATRKAAPNQLYRIKHTRESRLSSLNLNY